MALDRSVQPIVKDASGVLVGVAQVRVGLPSIRSAGTSAYNQPVAAGKSLKTTVQFNGQSVEIVKPDPAFALNGAGTSAALVVTGTYTGAVDGAYIIRAVSTTSLEVFAPTGKKLTALTIATGSVTSVTLSDTAGLSVSGTLLTSTAIGDTWVVAVWSGIAQDSSQTNIISPFSTLSASNSVGGLKGSKLSFSIGSVKKLESGFPTYVADQIIDSTSVSIGWESLEYNNSTIQTLRNMMNEVINNGNIAAIPAEILCRTRGGGLYTYWCPSVSFSKFPEISPSNDYSSTSFEMEALKMTEITPAISGAPTTDENTRNAWLTAAPLYQENRFAH